MSTLRKLFPRSFAVNSLSSLITTILVYVILNAVLGFVFGILSKIMLVGFVFSVLGGCLGVYFTAAIVVAILRFLNVLY
ncbi:MAG: hypothetical protein IJF60_06685 [Agathobacter sp.]|nr:hypothetical protein [Agathobacter sp.]